MSRLGEGPDAHQAFLHARVAHRSRPTLGLRFLGFDPAVFAQARRALEADAGEASRPCGAQALDGLPAGGRSA